MARLLVERGSERDAHTSIRRRTRREEQVARSIRVDFGDRVDRDAHTSIRRRARREEQVSPSIGVDFRRLVAGRREGRATPTRRTSAGGEPSIAGLARLLGGEEIERDLSAAYCRPARFAELGSGDLSTGPAVMAARVFSVRRQP
jgi:hypothetical protein